MIQAMHSVAPKNKHRTLLLLHILLLQLRSCAACIGPDRLLVTPTSRHMLHNGCVPANGQARTFSAAHSPYLPPRCIVRTPRAANIGCGDAATHAAHTGNVVRFHNVPSAKPYTLPVSADCHSLSSGLSHPRLERTGRQRYGERATGSCRKR